MRKDLRGLACQNVESNIIDWPLIKILYFAYFYVPRPAQWIMGDVLCLKMTLLLRESDGAIAEINWLCQLLNIAS
jgi:hypothetical protein